MLKHKTIPPGVDQPGFTGVTPSLYAEEHLFSEGTHGALLHRSTLTTDGSGWITSAQGILVSTGALEIPSFTTTLGFALTITGAVTLSSTLSAGATTLASVTVTAGATVGTTLAVTGAVVFSSTLTAGATTLAALTVTAGATIGTTLGVTGNATVGGTLGVTGAVTGGTYNGQTISATASFTGSLAVATNATVAGTLGVTGAVTGGTYNGQTISATASFTGSLAVATNATIGGTLGVTGAVTGGTYNSQTISATANFTGTLTAAGFITGTVGFKERGLSTAMGETTTWTPTFTGFTLGNGTVNARFSRVGKTIFYRIFILWGSTTAITSSVIVDLPHAFSADASSLSFGGGIAIDSSAGQSYPLSTHITSSTQITIDHLVSPITGISGTVPFTFTTSDQIYLQGWYHMS